MIKSLLPLLLVGIAAPIVANDTDTGASEALTAEILAMDERMFDAFNLCDVDVMAELFDEDLEFFHDVAGLSGYADTMRVTEENCDRKLGLLRTLIEESTEVFPIPDYGAMQLGRHTFCHVENGENDCGTFRFVHVWKRTDAGWKMTRVLSFAH